MAKRPGQAKVDSRLDPWAMAIVGSALFAMLSLFGSSQAEAADVGAVVLAVAGLIAAATLFLRRPVGFSRLAVAWLAFLAWALVSAGASGRIWSALMGEPTDMVGWFALAAAGTIALAVSMRGAQVRAAIAVAAPYLLAGEIVVAIVQLVLGSGAPDVGTVVRGTLPNSTYLGEALILLLPWVLVHGGADRGLSPRFRGALALATVTVLAASASRVAAVLALVWIGSFMWTEMGVSKRPKRLRVSIIAAVAVLALGAGLFFARAEVLGSTRVLGDRPQMWAHAVRAVASRPLTGFGPDGFLAGGVAVSTPDAVAGAAPLFFGRGSTDPHNLLLWVAVSCGLVGLLLFGWGSYELVARLRAQTRLADDGAGPGPAVWGAAMAAVMFLTAPAAIQVVPLFALSLGAAVLPLAGARVPGGGAGRASRWSGVAWTSALVAGILAATLLLGDAATRLPLETASEGRSPAVASSAQSASDLWRADPHLAYLSSIHWGWAVRANPALAAGRPDLAAIDRALSLDARDPFLALERARTLAFYSGSPQSIDSAYREAIRRWPLFPVAHAEYAVFLARQGREAEARTQIDLAREAGGSDAERDAAVMQAKTLLGE